MENLDKDRKESDIEVDDNLVIKSDELSRELSIFISNEGRNENEI